MIHTLAFVLVLGLASYRATRLVTRDTITDPLRTRVARWAYDENRERWRSRPRQELAQFLTCPFCVGVWATAALYLVWCTDTLGVGRGGVVVLAACGAQAYVASRPGA